MAVKRVFLVSFILFILVGAFGLEANPEECRAKADPSERMSCLHYAAITFAYLPEGGSTAQSLCYEIYDGLEPGYRDTDTGKRADSEKNLCFYDVAKITRNENICDSIADSYSYSFAMKGAEVTKEMCISDVRKLKILTPEEYYGDANRKNTLCFMIFVLPALLAAVILKTCP